MNSNTIIIVLLLVLISLYIWDIMNREGFLTYDDNLFMQVNYNTLEQKCDSLAGPSPCKVKTVKPKRKIVCDKKLDFESPNVRIGYPPNARSQVKYGADKEVDFGMSLDELDNVNEVDSEFKPEIDDDVLYNIDRHIELNNKKTKESIIREDMNGLESEKNTLSDIDENLL